MSKILKKVMVFGVFDGLHEGHRYFLSEAAKHGDELIVVVARDEMVRVLKNKTPRHTEEERRLAVARLGAVTRAVLGDREQGVYNVIKKYNPDIICIGHDQHALAEDLEKRMARGEIPRVSPVRLQEYEGERRHISLLIKKEIKCYFLFVSFYKISPHIERR